jgi:CubicO group peptidase (beta-lactamase class C family)
MNTHHIPGYAACIIKNGKIAWAKGYGYADITKNIPFTPNTVMPEIASISKTITATALMQLWEQGYFHLDDAINNYLPFAIINPYFPDSVITFRMLLNHTSSLGGGDELVYNFYSGVFTKPGLAEPLGDFLRDYYVIGGSMYVDSISFYNNPPGTKWNYSNYGFALLGYLVEQISGMNFDQYCKQNIFLPLCMNHTGYHFSDVDTNIVARPYYYDAGNDKQVDYGLYETAPYPPVQLKTTVIDFSKFLMMNMNNGTLDGIKILDSSTVALMRTSEVLIDPAYYNLSGGLAWFYFLVNGKELWGHPGDDFGLKTLMFFNITDSTGIIQFINGEDDATNFDYCANTDDIFCKLMEVADTISTSSAPDLNCSYVFNPCEHSRTYWKDHSNNYALNSVPMKLGTLHFYNKQQLLTLLNKPVNGNASIVLAKELITAKLNEAQGSELSPIISTINAANNLIGNRHLPIYPLISFHSALGTQMLAMAANLDSYNHKLLNTVNCSGNYNRENSEIDEMDNVSPNNAINIYPNPFSSLVTITFSLNQSENISAKIFDLKGRLIKTLVDFPLEEGENELRWNAMDEKGNYVETGIYFLQFISRSCSETKIISVIK